MSQYLKYEIAKPVAAFSASPTSGKAPLNVKFTDKNTGLPEKWKWSFGDETISREKIQNISVYRKENIRLHLQ